MGISAWIMSGGWEGGGGGVANLFAAAEEGDDGELFFVVFAEGGEGLGEKGGLGGGQGFDVWWRLL